MSTGTGGTTGGDLPIRHSGDGRGGTFYVEQDGERLAEMTYALRQPGRAVIEHTRVDDRLGGRGVGRRLVHAGVAWARESGTKLSATCSYARSVFQKEQESVRDVLDSGI